MVAIPPLTAILLPGAVALPRALRSPSLLLLPRGRLLLCALRLLLLHGRLRTLRLLLLRPLLLSLLSALRGLLGRLSVLLRLPLLRLLGALRRLLGRLSVLLRLPLLRLLGALLRLLGGLSVLLRLPLLRLLGALLRLLCLPLLRLLGALLRLLGTLLRLLRLLLLRLLGALLRSLGRLSVLLLLRGLTLALLPRVQRSNRRDNQKQSGGAGRSNQLHSFGLRKGSLSSRHADHQSARHRRGLLFFNFHRDALSHRCGRRFDANRGQCRGPLRRLIRRAKVGLGLRGG